MTRSLTLERDGARQEAEALLCAEVLADAQKQAEELLGKVRSQAAEIEAAAERQSLELRKEALVSAEAEAALRRGFILAAVPLEQARMRAARIESLLEQLRSEALSKLIAREGFEPLGTIVRLASEAARSMSGGEFVLVLCVGDHSLYGPAVLEELRRGVDRAPLRFEIEQDASWSECGVIVRDRDGRRVWDNRLSARLDRLWPALRREIARRAGLAGEDAGGPGS